jgi:uncharacterized protein YerC
MQNLTSLEALAARVQSVPELLDAKQILRDAFLFYYESEGYSQLKPQLQTEVTYLHSQFDNLLDALHLNKSEGCEFLRESPAQCEEMPSQLFIKERRYALGLSLRKVSDATGVSPSTISRIEQGHECEFSNLKALHDFYKSVKETTEFTEIQEGGESCKN